MRYKVEMGCEDRYFIVDSYDGRLIRAESDYGNAEEYCAYLNDMQAEAEFEIEAKAAYRAKDVGAEYRKVL